MELRLASSARSYTNYGLVACVALSLSLIQVTWAQVPGSPTLHIESTGNVVDLSWTAVSDADGYVLYYADYPDVAELGSVDLGATLAVSGELPPGSAYYVGVQAYNGEGVGMFSNVDYFSLPSTLEPSPGDLCSADPQDARFAWPLPGQNGRDWTISNYVDLTPGTGISDYASAHGVPGKAYDGHNGVDIAIPTFREQDRGVGIYAIQGGVVVDVKQSFPDRATSCQSNDWNVVTVRHADGTLVYYGHMKSQSAAVEEGQTVVKGDLLGQVGSSGCSTAPHLHLELRSPGNEVIDPFRDQLWCDAPAYEFPLSVFTGVLLEAPANQYANAIKDPPPDVKSVPLGASLVPILHSANGAAFDSVGLKLLRPDGSTQVDTSFTLPASGRHGVWIFNTGTLNQSGIWTVHYLANSVTQYLLQVEVVEE